MFKKGDVIDIKMDDREFIGVADYHDKDTIEIKDAVRITPQTGTNQVAFNPLKTSVIFYRQRMIVMEISKTHSYYKPYKEAVTGIVLPGGGRFNN